MTYEGYKYTMAILRLEDGKTYTQIEDINHQLATLNIKLERWAINNPKIYNLLKSDELLPDEEELIIDALKYRFDEIHLNNVISKKKPLIDMVFLHPGTDNLDDLLAIFSKCHTQNDIESRYILDGEGIFGFVDSHGTQIELTIQAEEHINVPSGIEHWFRLTNLRRIKAIRYFASAESWEPVYTNTKIKKIFCPDNDK